MNGDDAAGKFWLEVIEVTKGWEAGFDFISLTDQLAMVSRLPADADFRALVDVELLLALFQ